MRAFACALVLAAPVSAQQADAPAAEQRVNPQTEAARAWGFADSDVPADPAVRYGVLPNGMRYAVRRNTTPRGTVAMRLRFDIGSLAENDDERGLAHFVEHMAFNGSAGVPEGEMVPLLERSGLSFGADTNASTGYDATIYQLDLPQNTDALIDTGLMLLRETASELTIAPDAVERERGVIEAERRTRDTYGTQASNDRTAFLFKGSRLPVRMPIGDAAIIRTAPAATLRAFYDRWYRPERATLVVVGDIDVDAIEARIARRFVDWRGRGDGAPRPDAGAVDLARAAEANVFVHPAIAESVDISWFRPWRLDADTRANREIAYLESIGQSILSRRLSRTALAADAPFIGARFSESDVYDTATVLSVAASARDGGWAEALAAIETAYRAARLHGFTQAEVDEQLAIYRTGARNAVAGAATRRSDGLAGNLVGAADGRSVVTTPAFRAELLEALAPRVTAESVSAAFRAMTDGGAAPLVGVTAKGPIVGGEAAVLAALEAATRVAVVPPDGRVTAAFAYGDAGSPGAIVADERIEDLGIRRIRFANNVMLNLKTTDFEDDRVRIRVRIDGGDLLAPADDPTRVALAALVPLGGLEAHSADELRSVLAGRSVAPSFSSGTDAFVQQAATSPADFALQLQLLTAQLLHPGYRPEALSLMRRVLPQQYAAGAATPAAVLGRDSGGILADGDPRVMQPPLGTMLALDWPAYRGAVADALANGAIEIGVVGAIDEAAAIAAIAVTYGALPERRAAFEPRDAARVRRFASDRTTRNLYHTGEPGQAIVRTYWQARDDGDLAESLRIELTGAVLRLLLTDELREAQGRSYSPSAGAELSSDFPGFGYLYASSAIAVGDIAAVEAAIDRVAQSLREAPVSDDLLARARSPWLEGIARSRRENGYWLGLVAQATSGPQWLERSRRAEAEVRAITAAEVQAIARTYLTPERRLRIRAVPEGWTAP